MRSRLSFAILLVLLASCFDENQYDFDQVNLSPTMAIPVAFGDMGLVDLISNKDTSYIRAYPDGLLYLSYAETLPSRDIRDQFVLPDNQSIVSFDLPAGTLPASASTTTVGTINRQIDLGLSPELLTEILMKGGAFEHSLLLSKTTSPPNLPLETTITLLDVLQKDTQQPLVVVLGNGTGSVPLNDYLFQLTDNRFDVRVDLRIKPHPATFIPAGTQANVSLGFTDMEFAYIKGFFGDQVVALPPQTIEVSVFSSSLNDATVSFAQPQLSMTAVNDYGVPCEVTFSVLRARKGTSTLPLQISPSSPFVLQAPAQLGQSATTPVTITNQQAVINFGPEQLEYTASARINKGLSSGVNFMADTSKLRVTLNTEIPLYGKISGITVIDTLDVDLSDISRTKVGDASFKVTAQNELPLDAYIQIYLLDSEFQVLDSVFASNQTHLVKASIVDASGDLQHAGITNLLIPMNPDRLSQLFVADKLLVKAVMSTAKDQNDVALNVKFRSSYRLKLNMGLLATLNIEVK